jgi:hypothetical protein
MRQSNPSALLFPSRIEGIYPQFFGSWNGCKLKKKS